MNQPQQLLLLDLSKPVCTEGLLEVARAYGMSQEDAERLTAAIVETHADRFVGLVFSSGGHAWYTCATEIEAAMAEAVANIRQGSGTPRGGHAAFLCDADLADNEATTRFVKWMLAYEDGIQDNDPSRLQGGCEACAA